MQALDAIVDGRQAAGRARTGDLAARLPADRGGRRHHRCSAGHQARQGLAARRAGARRAGASPRSGSPPPRRPRSSTPSRREQLADIYRASRSDGGVRLRCRRHRHAAAARRAVRRRRERSARRKRRCASSAPSSTRRIAPASTCTALRMTGAGLRYHHRRARDRLVRRDGRRGGARRRRLRQGARMGGVRLGAERRRRPSLAHWLALIDIADGRAAAQREENLRHVEELAVLGRIDATLLHRLATVLDALEYNVPIPLWEAASRTPQPASGYLPETGVLSELQDAAKKHEFGRTVLLAMKTLGPNGAEGAHMIALGDSIRALKRAGLEADARTASASRRCLRAGRAPSPIERRSRWGRHERSAAAHRGVSRDARRRARRRRQHHRGLPPRPRASSARFLHGATVDLVAAEPADVSGCLARIVRRRPQRRHRARARLSAMRQLYKFLLAEGHVARRSDARPVGPAQAAPTAQDARASPRSTGSSAPPRAAPKPATAASSCAPCGCTA